MSKNKIEMKQIMETAEVIEYLEELLKCFKAGKIVVERGADILSMDLPGTVKVEIAAKQKEDKGGFSMELGWRSDAPESLDPMKISQCEPAAVEEPVQENVEADEKAEEPGQLTAKPESAPVATGSADDVVRREPSAPVKQEEAITQEKEAAPEAAETSEPSTEPIPMPEAPEPEAAAEEEKKAEAPVTEQAEEKAASEEPVKAEPAAPAKKPAGKAPAKKPAAKKTAGRKPAAKKKTAP